MRISRKRKGFKIIELVISMAIMGVLAAIAIPAFGGHINIAGEASDDATARIIQNGLTMGIVSNAIQLPASGTATVTINRAGEISNQTLASPADANLQIFINTLFNETSGNPAALRSSNYVIFTITSDGVSYQFTEQRP